eukprot:TRINITY_DN8017_c0_g1_i1.p1 TRINITY_DN8017_c0_g1~~TRINITY_DN8017_c0_g1_i1.p1  ORF type:complete len:166 (-),score=11.46 TRINITY_DN8017_c0_g1_i1:307-804(-)
MLLLLFLFKLLDQRFTRYFFVADELSELEEELLNHQYENIRVKLDYSKQTESISIYQNRVQRLGWLVRGMKTQILKGCFCITQDTTQQVQQLKELRKQLGSHLTADMLVDITHTILVYEQTHFTHLQHQRKRMSIIFSYLDHESRDSQKTFDYRYRHLVATSKVS